MIVIDLPSPPSTNALFKNIRNGRALTKPYKQWRWDAGWAVVQQKVKPIKGPVHLQLQHSARRKADLDNLTKSTIDLLVAQKVIEGDGPKIVRRIESHYMDNVEGARVVITPVTA